jgi:hypothetical protein
MIRRVGVLVLMMAALWGVALGQQATLESTPPSRAQVLQLMSAMGVQQSIDSSLQKAQGQLKLAARNAFLKKNPEADAATLKKLDEVFDGTQLFSFEAVSEALIPAYEKNLSAADVQAGIDFYSSEAGKRILEKLPAIIKQANESGGQLVQQKLAAYSEELEHKLKAFQAELDAHKPPEKPMPADDKAKTDTTNGMDRTPK